MRGREDADVAGALIDGGADLEAPDGSIGTPLDNAVGYACWHVARLLVARGAKVDKLWHAAALGMMTRVEELLASRPATDREGLSQAFWHACSGGQRRTAELLRTWRGFELGPGLREGNSVGRGDRLSDAPAERDHVAARSGRELLGDREVVGS
jgi:hypothetical protein